MCGWWWKVDGKGSGWVGGRVGGQTGPQLTSQLGLVSNKCVLHQKEAREETGITFTGTKHRLLKDLLQGMQRAVIETAKMENLGFIFLKKLGSLTLMISGHCKTSFKDGSGG